MTKSEENWAFCWFCELGEARMIQIACFVNSHSKQEKVKEKVQKVEEKVAGQSRVSGSPHRITKSSGKSSGSYEGDPTPSDHYFWVKSTA